MMRIRDIVNDTHGYKRLAKLMGMKAGDKCLKDLYRKLEGSGNEKAPIGEEKILISCDNGHMALVGKKYIFLKTAEVECMKTYQIAEKMDLAVLANLHVPEFLLLLTKNGGHDNAGIQGGYVIRAARQQIVEEGLYTERYGYWMQLLYRPYDFQYFVGQLFQTNQPNAGRLQELYRKFKEEFAVNYLMDLPIAEDREIRIG